MRVISDVALPQALTHLIFKNPFLIRLITKFAIANYVKPFVYTISLLSDKNIYPPSTTLPLQTVSSLTMKRFYCHKLRFFIIIDFNMAIRIV